jgi:PEP-CTERM motif
VRFTGFLASGFSALALATVSPAHAIPVSLGETFTATFDQPVAGGSGADLTASMVMTVTALTATEVDMSITLSNTTAASQTTARLTAIGWDSNPAATGATATYVSGTDGSYTAFVNKTFPSFTTVDLCLGSGPTCAGGSSTGLFAGQSESLTLAVNYTSTAALDFSTFADKFQTGFGSFETAGTVDACPVGISCQHVPPQVPEPATLPLVGGALAALWMLLRARKSAI